MRILDNGIAMAAPTSTSKEEVYKYRTAVLSLKDSNSNDNKQSWV